MQKPFKRKKLNYKKWAIVIVMFYRSYLIKIIQNFVFKRVLLIGS